MQCILDIYVPRAGHRHSAYWIYMPRTQCIGTHDAILYSCHCTVFQPGTTTRMDQRQLSNEGIELY